MWVCSNCGHSNSDNKNHCKYCNFQREGSYKKPVSIIIPIMMTIALVTVVSGFWLSSHLTSGTEDLDRPEVQLSVTFTQEPAETFPGILPVKETPNPTPIATIQPASSSKPVPTPLPRETDWPVATPIVSPIQTPSRHDLDSIGSKIDYPSEDGYLKSYRFASIKAPKAGWSVYGFKHLLREDNAKDPDYNIVDGTRVVVISSQVYGLVCCILKNEGYACWINEKYIAYQD